jgi:hypothetical protein
MSQIDGVYHAQRLRIRSVVTAAAARAFAQLHGDRERTIAAVVPLVLAGQRQQVALVDAYMTAKTREATGAAAVRGLDPELYTIAVLRGVAAEVVYERPFGAIGAQIEGGAEFATALGSAQAYLAKTVSTDLQLAQTHAARDWMVGDERIVGYRRVLGGGHNCSLCSQASTRTYRKSDLAAIHEHCHCSVQPLFGRLPVASIGTNVRIQEDPEIGPRLMAESWSEVGPRLID